MSATHGRRSGPFTTSHVNKHLRYRLSKLGYAWLLLITCCVTSLSLQIISMSTNDHLVGEAGGTLTVGQTVYHGFIRRTYGIFRLCSASPLDVTARVNMVTPVTCTRATSECRQITQRMHFIQACSIIAVIFTGFAFFMMLAMVGSRALRAMTPLHIVMVVLIATALAFRLTLWSLIIDFLTNTSLCNNAYLLVEGVPEPRYGYSFIVEVISWIFLLFTFIALVIVIAFEHASLRSKLRRPSASCVSARRSSAADATHPTYASDL